MRLQVLGSVRTEERSSLFARLAPAVRACEHVCPHRCTALVIQTAGIFDARLGRLASPEFFEAHEVLETVWLKAEGDDKIFLHGLIQVAAAFHHQSRENIVGCRSLIEKGSRKLAGSARGTWAWTWPDSSPSFSPGASSLSNARPLPRPLGPESKCGTSRGFPR